MNLEKEKEKIVKQAIKKGLLTNIEFHIKWKGRFIDHYGIDSIYSYLIAVMAKEKIGGFITSNEKMLKERQIIEDKFGLKIKSLEEIADE